jgi:hypothetical protein
MKTPPTPDPALQGEGNYTAARRHRRSTEAFVGSGKVDEAADKAAPRDEKEAQVLQDAERAGKRKARK